MSTLPLKLQEIVSDFASMSREEKLEALLAYAESLPPRSIRSIQKAKIWNPYPSV